MCRVDAMLSKATISATLVSGFTLAAISDGVFQSLIAAGSVAIASLIGLAASYISLKNKIVDNQRIADERADARAVATDLRLAELQKENRERAERQDLKLGAVAKDLAKVEVNTNSLTEKLNDVIEKEALLRGGNIERDRAAVERAAVDVGVKAVSTPSKIPAKVAEEILENKENADSMVKHLKDKKP